jgi:2-polyprenyl-6-methoxyphenol hydroxylase-like FAD-dependent oxidoreductase
VDNVNHLISSDPKMAANDTIETTDVLIVGCGPTGALLTVLLGQFGVQNIVLEKEARVTDDPRGITLDEDGIRLLQEIGIYDKVYTEMGSCEFVFFQ